MPNIYKALHISLSKIVSFIQMLCIPFMLLYYAHVRHVKSASLMVSPDGTTAKLDPYFCLNNLVTLLVCKKYCSNVVVFSSIFSYCLQIFLQLSCALHHLEVGPS